MFKIKNLNRQLAGNGISAKLCAQVCYYRDKQSINKFQVAKVTTAGGVTISEPFALDMKWDYKLFAAPTKWAIGSW